MASQTTLLDIRDLRGGRNGVDSPLELEPDQCVEAINVDWYQGLLARKRKGAENVSLTGAGLTGAIYSLIRHMTAVETDNELWAFQANATCARLVDGAWQAKTLVSAGGTNAVLGATFNGKLFLAYQTVDGRLHVWDGTAMRVTGITKPPVVASVGAAAGTGLTGSRAYRVAYTIQSGGVTVRRSEVSEPSGRILSNQGGWVVTRGAAGTEGETHWELYGVGDYTTANRVVTGPYYLVATLPMATTSYTDTVAPADFPTATMTLWPAIGAYTLPPAVKYLLVDEARLLLGGIWGTGGYPSRVWWTPVLNDASGVGNDERLNWTATNNPFIDFDPGDGGDLTGLGGPLFDAPYVFKFDRIYKMVRTGLAGAPYRPVTVSKKCGAIRHQTIVLGEDESGSECLYFLSRRGPYRLGVNGLQYCGRDIEDLWAQVDLVASSNPLYGAHGIYHPDLHQVWWWVDMTNYSSIPSLKIVFDVKQGRFTQIHGVRRGWSQHTGPSASAFSSVMYSAAPGPSNSLTLKPYIGQGTLATPILWRLDTGVTDVGTSYDGLIRTRVELPGGSVAIHGGTIEGHLVSFPPANGAATPLRITTIRDFGLERRNADFELPLSSAQRLITPIRDIAAASAAALQIEIADRAPGTEWTLDELVLRVRREEDR